MRSPLIIPPGINRDDTTFYVSGSAWGRTDKVRFWRGLPQTIGGWTAITGDLLGGVCRGVLGWTDLDTILNIAFGTNATLEIFRDGDLLDITPAGLTPGVVDGSGGAGYGAGLYSAGDYSEPTVGGNRPRTWSLSTYGETLVANPLGNTIYTWSPVDPVALPLTNAPATVLVSLVMPTRQVMAFGCEEEVSGNFNPVAIRFSDIEDITDWTTSGSNVAGEVILEGGGRIMGARNLGTYALVWTDTSLFLGSYTSDFTQPWRFDRVGDKCGLMGPNAAVVVGQVAYWITSDGQFFGYALGSEPKVIVSPLQAEFSKNIAANQQDKVYASTVSEFGEVRFDYPDQRDGVENSRYVTLSTLGDGWAEGRMERTAFVDAGPMTNPVATMANGEIFYHESGTSANGSPIDWEIETADTYLGEGEQLMLVEGVWPDFKDQQGSVSMDLTFRQYPQGALRSKGPYVLSPGKTRKDFRAQGRVVRMRLYGNSSPAFVRLGKLEFDIKPTGYR